jgi:hypothetical protein
MMKKLNEIFETTAADIALGPMDPATKRFLEIHKVIKTENKPGSPEAQDELFTGSNIARAPHKGKANEEAEPIEELSTQTIGKYIKKASFKMSRAAERCGEENGMGKSCSTADKRAVGLDKAAGRLMVKKEETERDENFDRDVEELVEAFGGIFSLGSASGKDSEVISPDHHSGMYHTFASQSRDHDMHAAGHESFLKNKNITSKERKFHTKAAEAHTSLRDAYTVMASHHLDLLNQAHKASMKKGK